MVNLLDQCYLDLETHSRRDESRFSLAGLERG